MEKKTANELCNAIIPILGTSSSIDVIKEFELSDLIILWTNAARLLDSNDGVPPVSTEMKKKFLSDMDEIFMMIRKKVLKLTEGYTLEDDGTKLPFLSGEGCIYLFLSAPEAEKAERKMQKAGKKVTARKILNSKLIDFFADSFFRNGAIGILIYAKQHFIGINKNSFFMERGLPWETKETNDTLQPELVKNACLFEQELLKTDDKKDYLLLTERQEDFKHALRNATLIVPVRVLEDGTWQYPLLTDQNKENGTPIFSDWIQFGMHYDVREWKGIYCSVRELLKHSNTFLFILNFTTNCLTLRRDFLENLIKGE